MEVVNCNFLSTLFNNTSNINNNEELKISLYLTLLSLSNNNYSEEIMQANYQIVDNFLRKLNNLKVKIQLKRKDSEIELLLQEVLKIYQDNKLLISKYNKENLDLENIIKEKNAKDLTTAIDKLTKVKLSRIDKHSYYQELRKNISSNIFTVGYYLKDNNIIINTEEPITISLTEFYDIYEYLLNVDTYQNIYQNNKINRERIKLIGEIVKNILNTQEISKEIKLSIILTLILPLKDLQTDIDMTDFKVNNIKISDLYSLAKNKQNDNSKSVICNNIPIPNQYIIDKVKELSSQGLYYFEENNIYFESKNSDLKISIQKDQLIKLLQQILLDKNKVKTLKIA